MAVTDSIVWGDYASERGIVNALCNGLMVNTVPIIPKGQEKDAKYKLKIDEYGYQYAGSYGGWNSKPGVQYVPYGRRPMAPFTLLENPVDEPIRISLSVNNEAGKEYVILPKQQLSIETDISHIKNAMKVSLKGDRRTILLKTILGMKHSRK